MIHKMNLDNKWFNKIKNGSKKIELRLYDEKRRKLQINDYIEFENRDTLEKILVRIVDLCIFKNFYELYNNFDKVLFGYDVDSPCSPSDMEKYYSKDEQEKYGVVAIKIELLK